MQILTYFLKKAEAIAPHLHTRKMPELLDYLETDYADLAMYCAKHQGRGQVRVWARDCSEMTTIPADL